MKWKISTVLLAIALVFVGCGESTDSTVSASDNTIFEMKEIYHYWSDEFYLYEDTETHIQYILYKENEKVAITPRYLRDDGTLYTAGGGAE